MNQITEKILNVITLSRLTGPIFDKELRVSSRRKRYYFLRAAYICVLTFILASIWTSNIVLNPANTSVFTASRMAAVAIASVTTIAWLQFIIAQLLSAVLLSTAISDEIYKNTLAVLMTTPITCFQLVIGKILSKLLLVILLICLSFPLLAIVRVFGGIPWNFVVLSFCVTISAALFTGSLSLFLSIFTRKSHNVLIQLLIILALLYCSLPILVTIADEFSWLNLPSFVETALIYCNPFAIMIFYTEKAVNPVPAPIPFSWPIHIAVMSAVSVVLILLSVLITSRRRFCPASNSKAWSKKSDTKIRSIDYSPLIWKELNTTSFSKRRIIKYAVVLIFILLILTAYIICGSQKAFQYPPTHVIFILIYLFLALLRISVIASSSITSEKEARTWPILLTTPLKKNDIAKAKIFGSIFRTWPLWLLISLHLLVFIALKYIHPLALIPLGILLPLSALTTSAIGVFISSACRKTSFAAIINIIVFFICIVPVCCLNPLPFAGPMVITGTIIGTASSRKMIGDSFMSLDFIVNIGIEEFLIASIGFVVVMLVYGIISYVCYALTRSNIRYKIF